MPALRLVHLLPLVSVAILALFHRPVNALVADRAQVARHVHAHDGLARRKRSGATCNTLPASSSSWPASSSSSAPASSSSPPASSSSYTPPASSSSPPASSSSSVPVSSTTTTTTPSSTNGQKKWGLAWGDDPALISNFASLPNVYYIYDWDCTIGANVTQFGLDYIPMFWGPTKVGNCQSTVVNGYANWVAGPNEPEISGQSNMLPSDAFSFFMQYVAPLASQGYQTLSPAITGAGVEWMSEFMAQCTANSACHIDCMAIHGYSTSSQEIIDFANLIHDTYNMSVCITEFAAEDYSGNNQQLSYDEVTQFAYNMTAFINAADWVIMAMPFGIVSDLSMDDVNTYNALSDSSGKPTELASIYYG